uniref:DUF4746 domain-containing protein n=1 Tax=Timema bartmani TaxID=61472 RepID=A0A7R9EPU9_9NEOP|nr:unnamed protein product [Timema bartmani]
MAARRGAQVQFQQEVNTDEEWENLLTKKGVVGYSNEEEKMLLLTVVLEEEEHSGGGGLRLFNTEPKLSYAHAQLCIMASEEDILLAAVVYVMVGRKFSVNKITTTAFQVLTRKPNGKGLLGRPRLRWESNIRIDLKETGCNEANSDNIEQLARFRNTSEPTWVIIAGGELVNVIFGANAPILVRAVREEIAKEEAVQAGKNERQAVPFDQLTLEELIRLEAKELLELEQIKKKDKELAIKAAVKNEERLRYLERFTHDHTVLLLMPFLFENGESEALQKMMQILLFEGYTTEAKSEVFLDTSKFEKLVYEGKRKVSEELKEELKAGETRIILFKFKQRSSPEGEAEEESDADLEEQPDALHSVHELVYKERLHSEKLGEEEVLIASFLEQYSKSPDVPAMWAPATPKSKVSAILELFPDFAGSFEIPETEEAPPNLTLIYDTSKKYEVTELAREHRDAVLNLAFFNSPNPDTAKKVADSVEEFDHLYESKGGEAMVVVINREKSEPLLTFCQHAPLYISPNIQDGERLRNIFFPPTGEFHFSEDADIPVDLDKPTDLARLLGGQDVVFGAFHSHGEDLYVDGVTLR